MRKYTAYTYGVPTDSWVNLWLQDVALQPGCVAL
jgi:hypothetical protein